MHNQLPMNVHPPPLPMVPPFYPVPGGGGTRVQGGLLIVMGLGLSVAMAMVAFWLYQATAFPALSARPSHWHGGPEFTRTTFELFGTVFFFGLVCMGGGTLQVCTGRRNRLLLIPMLLLLAAMAYLGHGIITATSAR